MPSAASFSAASSAPDTHRPVAGISVGEDGASHQCNEDLALMRVIPGMTVINPSDDIEAKAAVRALQSSLLLT